MEQRRFGSSDLTCSALGFGTWELSTTEYGPIEVEQATRSVHAALDAGVTLIDTAEAYGPYISEEILGRALGARRPNLVLVTKVGFAYSDAPKVAGRNSARDYIIARAEGCLRRLQTDYLDLLLIHWPDHNTPYDEPIGALEALVQAGKIRHYGVSNWAPAMMAAGGGHIAANQIGYHILDRRVERGVLPYCQAHGIGFMAYGSLGFGLLTGAFTPETSFVDYDWRSRGFAFGLPLFQREPFLKELAAVAKLQQFAAGQGKSVAQLAIAWVLSNPAVSVALVGMRNERELRENVAAVDWRLSADDRAEIDRILADEGVPTYNNAALAL